MKTHWLACSALVLLWTAAAQAQGVDAVGPYGITEETFQSPQNAALELRFGPYLPNIDDEFEGAGQAPFERFFGNENRYLIGFEIDWQLLRIPHVGTLGPGFGWGYTSMEATTFLTDGATEAEQTTSLSIMPMYAVGVFRADVVAKETPVPLVPYAKLGLGYALWWTDDGIGLSRADGVEGKGASYGYQWALGAMLLLDPFDPISARDLDSTTGVNNSYFFFEWYNSDLNGFGSGDQMQVGTNTWVVGLALEM